jgi:hypothetical protein
MNSKRGRQWGIVCAVACALLAALCFLYAAKSASSGIPSDLDYFKGSWTVALRNNPAAVFRWTVKDDLRGGWVVGVVEQDGERVSNDYWRRVGPSIERFAFTADGTFVRIAGAGWESGRMVLTGVASGKAGEMKIRETITKVSDRQFNALWEKQGADGKWMTFADEVCTR